MAATLRIELAGVGHLAYDLVDFLARMGLTGSVVPADGGTGVEISYRREDARRLLGEVRTALDFWLADRGVDGTAVHLRGVRSHIAPETPWPETGAGAGDLSERPPQARRAVAVAA